jgi:hypothetical protein
VSGFAKSAREVFSAKDPHPPHQPVETAAITPVAEVPREHVVAVSVAERKLPRQHQIRQAHVLRLSFVDGSGVDVLAGHRPEQAQRLLAMADGQR